MEFDYFDDKVSRTIEIIKPCRSDNGINFKKGLFHELYKVIAISLTI